jgi:hypothetical protein
MSDKYLRLNVANEKYTITCSDDGSVSFMLTDNPHSAPTQLDVCTAILEMAQEIQTLRDQLDLLKSQ